MTYRISGLPLQQFEPFFAMDASELEKRGARRVVATTHPGFPCRVSLEDAAPGESLILLNFTSHDATGPYRTAYAIYVREHAREADPLVDRLPDVFAGRTLSLRAFDAGGMVVAARLAGPGDVEPAIKGLFADPTVASIHAHNAAYGCFAARIERHGDVL